MFNADWTTVATSRARHINGLIYKRYPDNISLIIFLFYEFCFSKQKWILLTSVLLEIDCQILTYEWIRYSAWFFTAILTELPWQPWSWFRILKSSRSMTRRWQVTVNASMFFWNNTRNAALSQLPVLNILPLSLREKFVFWEIGEHSSSSISSKFLNAYIFDPSRNGISLNKRYCCWWLLLLPGSEGRFGRWASGCKDSECFIKCALVLNLKEQCEQANGRAWSCTMRTCLSSPSRKPNDDWQKSHLNGLTFWCTLRIWILQRIWWRPR